MKNYFIGLCFLLVAAGSCKKVENDSVFDKTADQRLTETLAAYQTQLTGATNGWKALLYTRTGGIFTFYFKFNESNRVQMLSSFDSLSAVSLKESSYRVKGLQQPSLLFDTYSYIHVLADPNPSAAGGGVGQGLVSDFEFYFDDSTTTANEIHLVGRFNGSKAVLTRATTAEAAAFTSGALAGGLQVNKIQTYFARIIIGGTDSTDVHVDPLSASVSAIDATGNLLDAAKKTSYFLTLGGLGFVKPLMVGTKSVSEINNMTFNTTTGTLSASAGGGSVVIKQVLVPSIIDLAAPKRWWDWADRSVYVGSTNGFHQNGVDDAFGLKTSIPGYQYVQYYPVASGPFDANRIIAGATAFGPAITPTFPTNGRVIFPNSGSGFGNASAPTSGPALVAFNKYRTQIWQAMGYYAVQTNGGTDEDITYDLISVADAKTWISWTY